MFAAARADSSISNTHDDLLAKVAAERDALQARVDALERAKATMKDDLLSKAAAERDALQAEVGAFERAKATMKEDRDYMKRERDYMKRERDVLADKVMQASAPAHLCAMLLGSDRVFDALLREPGVETLKSGLLSAILRFPRARDVLVAKFSECVVGTTLSQSYPTLPAWRKFLRKMLMICFGKLSAPGDEPLAASPADVAAILRLVFQGVFDAKPSKLQFHFIRELLMFAQVESRFAAMLSDPAVLGPVTSWWDVYLRFARPVGVTAAEIEHVVTVLRGLRNPAARATTWDSHLRILTDSSEWVGKRVRFPKSSSSLRYTIMSYDASKGEHHFVADDGRPLYATLFSYISLH